MAYYKTQNLIEDLVAERIVPGVNYAIIQKKHVLTATIGFSSILPKVSQLSPFFLYDLASLTKVLGTTNVFLQLYEQDRINFNEPLQEFIPDFGSSKVRLFHLLTHTSGIRGWIPNRDALSADQLLAALVDLPVTDEFEHRVRYADTNFILLGLVLEKIFHLPVQQVITNQILMPLRKNGLSSLTFSPDPHKCVPTAYGANGQIIQGVVHDPKARVLKEHCGSAGLFGNLEDLIAIGKSYLGLNDLLPIQQATLAALFSSKTPRRLASRSWGWDLRWDPYDQHPLLFHTGFTGTFLLFDRMHQTGLIVLTNRIHPSGHNQVFLTMRSRIIEQFLQENKN